MADSNLAKARLTSTVNRSMIVALGYFGARTLAHLWPRMRFEDFQRNLLRSGLPALSQTTGYTLLLPLPEGNFLAGIPDPTEWDDDLFIRRVARLRPPVWPESREVPAQEEENWWLYRERLPASLRENTIIHSVGTPGQGRDAYFENALEHSTQLGDLMVRVSEESRIDEHAPGREIGVFTVYLIGALHEAAASAFLWPLVMILRQRLGHHLPLKVVGLLNAGTFSDPHVRHMESATVYAGLRELEYFAGSNVDPALLRLRPKFHEWTTQPYFDRCYLLNGEKQNRTRANGEDEVIVTIGNALETFLVSDTPEQIAIHFGPDEMLLQQHSPFSTLGAASVYIPIDEWRVRNRQQYMLEVLQEGFLQQPENMAEKVESDIKEVIRRFASLEQHTRRLTSRCPFVVGRGSGRGLVGTWLRRAHQNEPIVSEGPSMPLPVVELDPAVFEVQYVETDPVSGRERRLPPERWLEHLYRHYRRLGLSDELLFPDDPELAAVRAELQDLERTRTDDWFVQVLVATDSEWAERSVEEEVATQNIPVHLPPIDIESGAATGILPEAERLLAARISTYLQQDNAGLLRAIAVIDELARHLRQQVRQLSDYRIRLHRMTNSDEMAEARTEEVELRNHFRELAANEPAIPSLFSRALMLAALLTAFFYYGSLTLNPGLNETLRLTAAVGGSLAGGLLAALLFLLSYWPRLRRAIGRIENHLAELFTLQVNDMVAAAFVNRTEDVDENGEPILGGVLPNLNDLVRAYSDLLKEALAEMKQQQAELEEDLARPLTIHQPFLRQPLPGLEELERQLQEEARPEGKAGFPERVLAERVRPETVGLLLQHLVTGQQAAYRSLGELILQTIARHAGRVGRVVPPKDLKIEPLLPECLPDYSHQGFLTQLRSRTESLLNWDDEDLEEGTPMKLELLSLEEPVYSPALATYADAQKLYPVASLDPFAITALRLVQGLRLQAVPHFQVYKEDFRRLTATDRLALVLVKDTVNIDGDYLRVGPESDSMEETYVESGP